MRVSMLSEGDFGAEGGGGASGSGNNPRVYRGGRSLQARRDIDVKIDKASGLVKPGNGISLDSNARKLDRFGGAFEIAWIPAELEIVNTHGTHFELAPREAMSFNRYQELLNQVKIEAE
jgi:hypothetical protein